MSAHRPIFNDEVFVRIGRFAVGFSLAIAVSCRAALACRKDILKIRIALRANFKYLWGSSALRSTCTLCRKVCKARYVEVALLHHARVAEHLTRFVGATADVLEASNEVRFLQLGAEGEGQNQ